MKIEKQKLQNAIRELRQYFHDRIAAEIENTEKTYAEIGATYGVSTQLVYQVARLRGLCRTAPQAQADEINSFETSAEGGRNGEL